MLDVIIGFVCTVFTGWVFTLVALPVSAFMSRIGLQWFLWDMGYAVSVALFFGTRKRLSTLAWSILAGATLTVAGLSFMLRDIVGD